MSRPRDQPECVFFLDKYEKREHFVKQIMLTENYLAAEWVLGADMMILPPDPYDPKLYGKRPWEQACVKYRVKLHELHSRAEGLLSQSSVMAWLGGPKPWSRD